MSNEPQTKLAAELNRQLELQAKLGEALLKELTTIGDAGREVFNGFTGESMGRRFVPDREWARCYGHYRTANKELLAEERERAKLRLMLDAKDGGPKVLTDEEYQREIKQLAMESVRELSDAELEDEIKRRGLDVEEVEEDES